MKCFIGTFYIDSRLLRERELEDKIRVHTLSMQSKRGKSHGTPQEEMQAAKRELQVVRCAVASRICCLNLTIMWLNILHKI